MPAAAGGPRILLRRLREIMAEQASAQTRLDKLVMVIAANMVAEVCSIYLRRAGNALELFATEGLNRDAVHRTRMRSGEGLVGFVADAAEPINLSNAAEHPRFAYRPETGEDPYRSFLGVPIVRGGQVYGVLTVQNRAARQYDEEEVEALQTVAMVLAEVVAHGALFDIAELDEPELRADRPRAYRGEGLSEGVAVGHVVLHEPRVRVDRMIADDPQVELERLDEALGSLRASVDDMLDSSELDLTGESREVIEAYRLFAQDQGWQQRLKDAVRTGLTADAAVERVQDELRLRVARAGDPFLRERLHDLEDLARRLQRHLSGGQDGTSLPRDAVLVARAMGPAELLDYGRSGVVALVLEDAATTSHVAIVARAMRIPVVGSIKGITDAARAGDIIVVDGETGETHLRPPVEIVAAFEARQTLIAQRVAQIAAVRDLPAVTRDGVPIRLMMNAGLLLDMPHLLESGADGVGLFRTELQFMIGQTMPRLADQISFYKRVIEAAGEKPIVFRTLDLGGDKILPYGRWEREENPALGWRAIRIALDRPALLRYQVRALSERRGGRTLRLLLPMVSDVSEFNAARALVDRELERARLMWPTAAQADARRRDARSARADVHAAANSAQRRFRFDRVERPVPVHVRRRPHQSARGQALRFAEPGRADDDPPDREERGRGRRRCFAVRGDGRPAARGHGADRAGPAHVVDAAGQYRSGEDDGAQPRHARSRAIRRKALRSHRSQPAYPSGRLCRRARDCRQIAMVGRPIAVAGRSAGQEQIQGEWWSRSVWPRR